MVEITSLVLCVKGGWSVLECMTTVWFTSLVLCVMGGVCIGVHDQGRGHLTGTVCHGVVCTGVHDQSRGHLTNTVCHGGGGSVYWNA